ncbi:MAG: hypothetical protein ACFFBR_04375 [Promethearchaeota archaeon]
MAPISQFNDIWTIFPIYNYFFSPLYLGIICLLISGILGGILIINGALYLFQRKHRNRLRRRPRRWRRPQYTPMEHEPQPPSSQSDDLIPTADNIDDIDLSYTNIPSWLIPLLKNRSTAMAIHEDLIASSKTPEEAESQFQSRIDDLDTVVITIYQHRQTEAQEPEPSDGSPMSLLTETEIEKEAVLDLLGALELQYRNGKVTKTFYEHKRDQLLERLAKAIRDTE